MGFGEFSLNYLRDKQKREVDFIVVRDQEPWFLVEVKSSERRLSPNLSYFQNATKAPHALQVQWRAPYDADCFAGNKSLLVPATTLLSQLLKLGSYYFRGPSAAIRMTDPPLDRGIVACSHKIAGVFADAGTDFGTSGITCAGYKFRTIVI